MSVITLALPDVVHPPQVKPRAIVNAEAPTMDQAHRVLDGRYWPLLNYNKIYQISENIFMLIRNKQ
jgi:hypothetical protein